MRKLENITKYEQEFSENKFWKKTLRIINEVSKGVLEKALILYYSAKDEHTPKWAKSVVFGSLGYLIFPFDAIPDIIPGVGYTDDVSVIIAAFSTVLLYIKDEHKIMAKVKLESLLN